MRPTAQESPCGLGLFSPAAIVRLGGKKEPVEKTWGRFLLALQLGAFLIGAGADRWRSVGVFAFKR